MEEEIYCPTCRGMRPKAPNQNNPSGRCRQCIISGRGKVDYNETNIIHHHLPIPIINRGAIRGRRLG